MPALSAASARNPRPAAASAPLIRGDGRSPTGANMTAHIRESPSAWPVDAAYMMPPRDPNDDDDDENEQDDDEESNDEPAVIREPDE
jgi:hypothetical protein